MIPFFPNNERGVTREGFQERNRGFALKHKGCR